MLSSFDLTGKTGLAGPPKLKLCRHGLESSGPLSLVIHHRLRSARLFPLYGTKAPVDELRAIPR